MISRRAFLAAGLSTTLISACGRLSPGGSNGRVTLDFFQYKPEAVTTFARIIRGFEAEYPHIRVVQNTLPHPETALRARLVRDDIPDVMTLNGNATWGEVAAAGVLYDFSGAEPATPVAPAMQQVLDALGTRAPGEINGLPFSANADGVLYNKSVFAEHDVAVPTTWSELIAAARTFRDAGISPFYGALRDAWTCMPPFNALASNLQPPGTFFPDRLAGRTTFAEGYGEIADKLAELYGYTQPDMAARDYNTGNQAFARGESAMYLQGIWAIPAIRSFQPDFEIGAFPLPATDDPEATRLISGIDVALTLGRSPRHPDEAMTFIRYLMRPDVMTSYTAEQMAFPTLEGTRTEDPELSGLLPYFEEGRIVGFSDHYIPKSVQLEPITQQFLLDGRRDAYLTTMDEEWDQYQDRRS